MSDRTYNNVFFSVITALVLALLAGIGASAWMFGYEAASAEWCAHVGGTFIDDQCYQGDVSPVDLGSGRG